MSNHPSSVHDDRNDIDWVFEPLGPHGARDAGDPAKHAFTQDTETFVREVLQNSVDQSLKESMEVVFRFTELTGDELELFNEAIQWQTLHTHLSGVVESDTESGRTMEQFLDGLDDELLLLTIEDRHTTGLEGPEEGGTSNFTALCKDRLYSHKDDTTAGGSYGLGKSVLWAFSGFSTVLFNSNLNDCPADQENPRLIGRSLLPSHQVGQHDAEMGYRGPGWFGRCTQTDAGEKAESIWGKTAQRLSSALYLDRDVAPGTSILIPGFRDPTDDKSKDTSTFIDEFQRASAKYFWPAIVDNSSLQVSVEANGTSGRVSATTIDEFEPFVECFEQQDSGTGEFERPGDIVSEDIEVEIPNKRDGTGVPTGSVTLVVRLAGESDSPKLQNHIARFRGTGMVVDYQQKRRLPLGSHNFHACLVCGTAKTNVTDADREIDEFLRAAEPPSHKEWTSTEALKQRYQRGYSAAIDKLERDVNDALKNLITPSVEKGERGPDRLRKRFPIGRRSGGPPGGGVKQSIGVNGMRAVFVEDRWEFDATMYLKDSKNVESWESTIELWSVGEDGTRLEELSIESIHVSPDNVETIVLPSAAKISADGDMHEVDLTGVTYPLNENGRADIGRIEFEIQGETIEEDQ